MLPQYKRKKPATAPINAGAAKAARELGRLGFFAA
jgi:hypothetical protein